MESLAYLREGFLDVAVNGAPHLGDHIGRFSGNLGCLNTIDASVNWSVPDPPRNPCTSQ